jgi:hypothetical protein
VRTSIVSLLALAAPTLLGSGCGGSPLTADAGDLAMPDLFAPPDLLPPPDLAVVPPALPQLNGHTRTVLSNPQIVTVTFPKYQYRFKVEGWGDFVGTSNWLTAVGKEYGVNGATHLQKVVLANAPPRGILDSDVVALIQQGITAGTLPPPTTGNGQLFYIVYFPSTTSITDFRGEFLCGQFAGYHHSADFNGTRFTYAVIGDCNQGADYITSTASHELIEDSTDPYDGRPGYFLDTSPPDPWTIENGQEVGDLCVNEGDVYEGGFALQRSWSNAAAAAEMNPCVPPPDGPYETVTTMPPDVQMVAAGMTVSWTLTGWSTMPSEPPWTINIVGADNSAYSPTQLGPQFLNGTSSYVIHNGSHVRVTLTVPASANSGDFGGVQILSGMYAHAWPLAFQVQ